MGYSALTVAPARPYIFIQGAQAPAFSNDLFERFIDYVDRK